MDRPPTELLAGLHLLDRQLLDAEGMPAGKVDDLELDTDPATGDLVVTALHSGRGSLARRLGWRGLAGWLARTGRSAEPPVGHRLEPIPWGRITMIGSTVDLDCHRAELATAGGDRWARDHITSHLPGSGRAPE